MKKKILWGIAILVVLGIVALIVVSAMTEERVTVNVKNAESKTVVQTVSASGKIEPVIKVDISAYVSGEITSLPVKEGDVIQRGDLLCELDSTRYQASRDQLSAAQKAAESQVLLARANLEQSKRDRKRIEELFSKSLVSEAEVEQARTGVEVQEATLRAAQDAVRQSSAALRQARDDVRKTTLTAPLDGVVIALNKEAGEIVMGSQLTRDIIMTVADVSDMEVQVQVDENDVPAIRVGQETTVEVDAFPDREFKGTVTAIGHSAKTKGLGTQEETTEFDVKVRLDGDVSDLRSGMSATANIKTEIHDDVVSVPIQCVTMRDPEADPKKPVSMVRADQLKDVVFKVNAENRAELSVVETGISSEFDIEVKSGLAAGDRVVCGPYKTINKSLKAGDLLEIQDENYEAAEEASS